VGCGKTAQRRFCTFGLKWLSAAPAALVRLGNGRVLYRAERERLCAVFRKDSKPLAAEREYRVAA
jgi:hypothetical protein